jgi:hypothetical protein
MGFNAVRDFILLLLLLLSSSSSSSSSLVSPLCRVIYIYIPETNHVSREHFDATILM